jgi:hypothetical protein
MPRSRRRRGRDRFPGRSTSSKVSTGSPAKAAWLSNTRATITPTSPAGSGRNAPISRCSGAPAVIIIFGRVEDCCRAGMSLALSAHARGLGTCWVGSPLLWLRTPEVKAELQIPPELTPGAVRCRGYPAGIPEPLPRERPRIIWIGSRPRYIPIRFVIPGRFSPHHLYIPDLSQSAPIAASISPSAEEHKGTHPNRPASLRDRDPSIYPTAVIEGATRQAGAAGAFKHSLGPARLR